MAVLTGTPVRQRCLLAAVRWEVATVAWVAVEALAGLGLGVTTHSLSLTAFGWDSVLEMASAAVLLWRLRVELGGRDSAAVAAVERRTQRWVGGSLLLVSAYVLWQAVTVLVDHGGFAASPWDLGLAVAAGLVMPVITVGKLRLARALGSPALRADALEGLACSYLAYVLVVGLAANMLWHFWWVDPVAALVLVALLTREGAEALREGGEAAD